MVLKLLPGCAFRFAPLRDLSTPCLLLLVWMALPVSAAHSQSIEITSPSTTVSVPEGDDFATSVLENPWDMSERRDIGYEENFNGRSIQSANGVWSGTNASPGGYIFPLFGGFNGSLQSEGLPGERDLPKFGSNHPVDSSHFSLLSYRLRSSARTSYAVYWTNRTQPTSFPDGSQFGSNYDGLYFDRAYPNQGYVAYSFDLRGAGFEAAAGAWTGATRALRIDPSLGGPAGAATDLDWVRLVDPASAPQLSITWRATSMPLGSLITVWYDTDGSGYDGTPLAHYVQDSRGHHYSAAEIYSTSASPHSSNGVHQLATALLPPGTYRFYVTAERLASGTRTEIARSGYSAPLVINARPSLVFSAPTQTSGSDYAAELHNAWDMSDPADVANLPASGVSQTWRQFASGSFVNGIFQAISELPLTAVGNAQGDPQVWLNVSSIAPIDANRFRYLTYRIGADETLFPTIHDKVAGGWVARPVFWGNDLFADGASTQAHVLYEGMHTYTIDLWNDSITERGMPWRAIRTVKHLRIDPHETSVPTWFYVDWAMLTSDNHPSDGKYRIRWNIQDTDSTGFTTSLYASPIPDALGSLLSTFGDLSSGDHFYDWPTDGIPAGNYYITAAISDGSSTSVFKAPAPVVIGAGRASGSALERVPNDFDGDGKSDPVVYRPAKKNSTFFARVGAAALTKRMGGLSSTALTGDFDGDGKSDLATVQAFNSTLLWLTGSSVTGQVTGKFWGAPGDIPVLADFDGDHMDDLTVFRSGVWWALLQTGGVISQPWGEPTDIAVPADYDGDGKADIAIWRPRDGTWWVLHSGFSAGATSSWYQTVQWGLPGDIPVPGDFDNDGKTDFAVFRPSTGTWYLRMTATDLQESYQWGLSGDIPLTGDYDGDHRLDLVVYRPGNGGWYVNNRSGSQSFAQWGLPSDRVPAAAGQ